MAVRPCMAAKAIIQEAFPWHPIAFAGFLSCAQQQPQRRQQSAGVLAVHRHPEPVGGLLAGHGIDDPAHPDLLTGLRHPCEGISQQGPGQSLPLHAAVHG